MRLAKMAQDPRKAVGMILCVGCVCVHVCVHAQDTQRQVAEDDICVYNVIRM